PPKRSHTGKEKTMDSWKASRAHRSFVMTLNAPPGKVFPLLCPVREYEWIPHWRCEMIYSESGVAEAGCVFTTDFSGEGKDVWVVSRYEPNRAIGFVRTSRIRTVTYDIRLSESADGKTAAMWSQILTGLNPEGNRALEAVTPENYRDLMSALQDMINHYLATGQALHVDAEAVSRRYESPD
ncbi:MAG: hypothetical protein LJE65_07865, partial [Desulfobacteraceae bacterium]|nr:hypothetical protein [Desulfobacteraceae bacterium]